MVGKWESPCWLIADAAFDEMHGGRCKGAIPSGGRGIGSSQSWKI